MNAPKSSPIQIDPAQNDLGIRFKETPNDEINVLALLACLVNRKRLILSVAIIFTILSGGYALSITPLYKATISFLMPQEIITPKELLTKSTAEFQNIVKETKKSLYQQFLVKIQSYNFQREVFDRGNFLERFVDNPNGSVKSDALVLEINKSITLTGISGNQDVQFDKPLSLEMTGAKPEAMAEFFNALVKTGIKAIPIEEHLSNAIDQRLKNISSEKAILLSQENKKYLQEKINLEQQVLQVKKNFLQKKINLEQQVLQGKINREKEIRRLTKELALARSMNIEENNFKSDQPLNNAPRWFLYGARILEEELKVMKSKAKNSDGIERAKLIEDIKMANINNTIKVESLNKAIKTVSLKNASKSDELSDNARVKSLDKELRAWVSFKNLKTPNVIVIDQPSIASNKPIPNKKGIFIFTGLIAGLIIGSLLAFFQEGMRNLEARENHVEGVNQKTNSIVFKHSSQVSG